MTEAPISSGTEIVDAIYSGGTLLRKRPSFVLPQSLQDEPADAEQSQSPASKLTQHNLRQLAKDDSFHADQSETFDDWESEQFWECVSTTKTPTEVSTNAHRAYTHSRAKSSPDFLVTKHVQLPPQKTLLTPKEAEMQKRIDLLQESESALRKENFRLQKELDNLHATLRSQACSQCNKALDSFKDEIPNEWKQSELARKTLSRDQELRKESSEQSPFQAIQTSDKCHDSEQVAHAP